MTPNNEEIDATPAWMLEQVSPSGIAVLEQIHENAIINFKSDLVPQPELPSLWRLAYLVSHETAPLLFYVYQENGV
jgi:hypothetical protein